MSIGTHLAERIREKVMTCEIQAPPLWRCVRSLRICFVKFGILWVDSDKHGKISVHSISVSLS